MILDRKQTLIHSVYLIFLLYIFNEMFEPELYTGRLVQAWTRPEPKN